MSDIVINNYLWFMRGAIFGMMVATLLVYFIRKREDNND